MSQIKPYKHCKKCGALIVSGSLCEDCKPMTNGDRIRAMDDEELAHWLNDEANYTCNICIRQNEKSSCYDYSCDECVAKWLKQEVQSDAGSKTD